jgi:hypothetical protein
LKTVTGIIAPIIAESWAFSGEFAADRVRKA